MSFFPFPQPNQMWTPADQGVLGWVGDPWPNGAQTAVTVAGTLQIMAIKLTSRVLVTNITMQCTTAGATLTAGQCFAALFAGYGGALVGVSADQSVAWTAVGFITMPLAGGPFLVGPGIAIVGWWYNGTTGPRWKGGDTNASMNLGLAPAASRFGSAGGGFTTTPPNPLGVVAASTISPFAALT